MAIFLNILLLVYSLYLLIRSIRLILKSPSKLTNYIFIVLIAFNTFPVFLDLLLGTPPYFLFSWYSYFDIATTNNEVNIIYSFFMILVLFILHLSSYFKGKVSNNQLVINESVLFKGSKLLFISILPIIFMILAALFSRDPTLLLTYASNNSRGFNNIFTELYIFSEIIGIIAFTCWYFERNDKNRNKVSLFIYYFLIAWFNGKRYIVVTQLLIFAFYYLNLSSVKFKKGKVLLRVAVFLTIGLLLYFYYQINFKLIGDLSFDFLYLSFRVDFGRDDVVKFVLYKELIEKSMILDFRGQSVLSVIFIFVPRSLWPSKPFPHYRYLTAALFGTSVNNIPAGMTPSIFELFIANFGVIFGVLFSISLLVLLITLAHDSKSLTRRLMYLVIIIVLLTQSLDAVMVLMFLIPFNGFIKKMKLGGANNEVKGNISK